MDSEKTVFDNSPVQPRQPQTPAQPQMPAQLQAPSQAPATPINTQTTPVKKAPKLSSKKNDKWQYQVIGGVVAVGLGAGLMSAISSASAPELEVEDEDDGESKGNGESNGDGDTSVIPEGERMLTNDLQSLESRYSTFGGLTDGKIPTCEDVNDDMSFAKAFNTARADVGPDGVFMWRGNLYSTHTAEEWDAMSLADKDHFYSHLSLDEPYTPDPSLGEPAGQDLALVDAQPTPVEEPKQDPEPVADPEPDPAPAHTTYHAPAHTVAPEPVVEPVGTDEVMATVDPSPSTVNVTINVNVNGEGIDPNSLPDNLTVSLGDININTQHPDADVEVLYAGNDGVEITGIEEGPVAPGGDAYIDIEDIQADVTVDTDAIIEDVVEYDYDPGNDLAYNDEIDMGIDNSGINDYDINANDLGLGDSII